MCVSLCMSLMDGELKCSLHPGTYHSQNKETLSVEEALFLAILNTVEAQMERRKCLLSRWICLHEA